MALLPLSYVPLELAPAGVTVAPIVVGLTLVAGFYYRVHRTPLGPVDSAALALGALLLIRHIFIPYPPGAAAWWYALRDTSALIAGLILFRLGRRADLRPAILIGLRTILVTLVAVEAYQLAVGSGFLRSRGYEPPVWSYFDEQSDYLRPFSLFYSPTVFGAYLAMIGIAVIWTSRTIRGAVLAVATVVVGLYLTQTRGAWVAFAVALSIALVQREGRRLKSWLVVSAIAGIVAIAASALLVSGKASEFIHRVSTLADPDFESNSVRVRLWVASLRLLADAPIIGHGAKSFQDAVTPLVGPALASYGHPHNNYLHIAYSLGTVGLVLFLILLGALAFGLRRARADGDPCGYRRGAMAALVVFAVDSLVETTWTSVAVTSTLFLLVGLGSVAVAAPRDSDQESGGPTGPTVTTGDQG